ncbi:MAG: hypothetical protein K2Y21_00770 [Phycisphaerales bacterium]|nr:hypothetical protein [Phycisphaerales bacterium]
MSIRSVSRPSTGLFGAIAVAALAGSAAAASHTSIAVQGAAAPGGGIFGAFSGPPSVNKNGEVAFLGSFVGGATSAVFRGNGSSSSLVATIGATTPLGGT